MEEGPDGGLVHSPMSEAREVPDNDTEPPRSLAYGPPHVVAAAGPEAVHSQTSELWCVATGLGTPSSDPTQGGESEAGYTTWHRL